MRKILLIFGIILVIFGISFGVLDNPYKYLIQSKACLRSGKVARAVEFLVSGSKKFPQDKNLAFELAKAYFLAGEIELASEKLKSLESVFSELSEKTSFVALLIDLSEANHRLGNKKYTEYFALQYLAFEDKRILSRKKINQLIKTGEALPDRAIKLWERAFNIAHAIGDSEAKQGLRGLLLPKYFKVVEKYITEKQYQEALNILDKSQIVGNVPIVHLKKASLYKKLGDYKNAQKHFEEALRLEPENNDIKIAYADFLRTIALQINDKTAKDNFLEKARLLLVESNDPKTINLLNKILSLKAKYNIADSMFELQMIGDYLYPSLIFKVLPKGDIDLKKYKVIFLNSDNNVIDEHEDFITNDEFNQLLELTSRIPVNNNQIISARLYLNDEFVKEYKSKN